MENNNIMCINTRVFECITLQAIGLSMSSEQNSLSIALIQHEHQNPIETLSANCATSNNGSTSPNGLTKLYSNLQHEVDQNNFDCDDSWSYCYPTRDDIVNIQRRFIQLLRGQDKANQQASLDNLSSEIIEANSALTEDNAIEMNDVLSMLLRLSLRCPIPDIKLRFKDLLSDIKVQVKFVC